MGESFYLDRPTRDLRGVLADNRVYEVDANEVRGYSLSEALRKLDKKEDRMVEEKWKPIMAGRKRKAEEEPELEGQYVEGQLAYCAWHSGCRISPAPVTATGASNHHDASVHLPSCLNNGVTPAPSLSYPSTSEHKPVLYIYPPTVVVALQSSRLCGLNT